MPILLRLVSARLRYLVSSQALSLSERAPELDEAGSKKAGLTRERLW
jgi:hypothetical protein